MTGKERERERMTAGSAAGTEEIWQSCITGIGRKKKRGGRVVRQCCYEEWWDSAAVRRMGERGSGTVLL